MNAQEPGIQLIAIMKKECAISHALFLRWAMCSEQLMLIGRRGIDAVFSYLPERC
ncbi:hypothetical protein VRK_11890 [Vibrio sp. MEBiC08052]|nr:hypothetical protein VRK_11890 [Vibrio sp. MEBiC08052]